MLKRAFDLVASLLGLLILSPFLIIVAILIKVTDPGPVLYLQERVGLKGKPFKIYKFRTMRVNADKMGAQITVGRDPRITPVGHWLRKLKFDEFIQLVNVVKGDMSLVGPRPEVPRYVAMYSPEQRQVLDVRPGITDPASIEFKDESEILGQAEDPEALYVNEIMPKKLNINLAYLRKRNLLTDMGVIFRTFYKVFVAR